MTTPWRLRHPDTILCVEQIAIGSHGLKCEALWIWRTPKKLLTTRLAILCVGLFVGGHTNNFRGIGRLAYHCKIQTKN